MELIDADSLIVSAEVPEEFIGEIDSGAEVKIVPAANKKAAVMGRVTQIAGAAVEKDGERIVRVEVTPDGKSEFLRPGYSVDVTFTRK